MNDLVGKGGHTKYNYKCVTTWKADRTEKKRDVTSRGRPPLKKNGCKLAPENHEEVKRKKVTGDPEKGPGGTGKGAERGDVKRVKKRPRAGRRPIKKGRGRYDKKDQQKKKIRKRFVSKKDMEDNRSRKRNSPKRWKPRGTLSSPR